MQLDNRTAGSSGKKGGSREELEVREMTEKSKGVGEFVLKRGGGQKAGRRKMLGRGA